MPSHRLGEKIRRPRIAKAVIFEFSEDLQTVRTYIKRCTVEKSKTGVEYINVQVYKGYFATFLVPPEGDEFEYLIQDANPIGYNYDLKQVLQSD